MTYRKRFRSTCLTFLGLIYILRSTDCYLTDEYDEDLFLGWDKDFFKNDQEEYETINDNNNNDFLLINKRDPAFTPYISVGALSNLPQFFENLKGNFKTLEDLTQSERNSLMVKPDQPIEQETRIYRPPATAAFLHAIRNQRPAHKIKNFEPSSFRIANRYGPGLGMSNLGRKR